jgi:uncharacterized protein
MPMHHKVTYHDGEMAVQERAGVRKVAEQSLKGLRDSIPAGAAHFLEGQPMLIIGAATSPRRVWASLLYGPPGFIHVVDAHTVRISSRLPSHDPLYQALIEGTDLGTFAIELETSRRLRVNGHAVVRDDGVDLQVREMFGNCQQYIQLRELEAAAVSEAPPSLTQGQALTLDQQQRVRSADTFFVASMHPQAGADVSHRGGLPGFVHVVGANELLWPDYSGNNMFQTLGNLALNPACGLLFLDFESGSTLQLSGQAEILWNDPRAADFAGARRLVRFKIAEIIEMQNRFPLHWGFRGYSPHNP